MTDPKPDNSNLAGRPAVLVVDDEVGVLKWLARWLNALGYEPVLAVSPSSALEILRCSRVDAIILDLRLDGHSGLDVLEFVRADDTLSHLPVMILTGIVPLAESELETIRRLDAYLFYKPEGIDQITAKLAELLKRDGVPEA